jgi:amino acid/peptide transporter (Peptide:H+ symporter), bacterial
MAAPDPSSSESKQNGGGVAPGEGTATAVAEQQDFFGHPRGLATLFFTELWERFSYYGLRALLVLFMTAPAGAAATNPGLGFGTEKATAIYGLYTAFVYLLALPGGWVADNMWGQRRSVFVGGCIIAAGHFSLAGPVIGLPEIPFFYLGLVLIVVGTGLLKPNISTMVGDLYPEGGARRDAGFSVFYMGINFGAILGPTLCGYLGEGISWHWGFSLAGFGMLAGLISYKLGAANLGQAGTLEVEDEAAHRQRSRNFYLAAAATVAVLVTFGFLATSGVIAVTLTQVAEAAGIGIILVSVLFFAYLTLGGRGVVTMTAFFAAATVVTTLFVDGTAFASQIGVGATVLFFILVNIARVAGSQFEVSSGGQAASRHLLALPALGPLLVGLRTGGLLAEPVCEGLHRPQLRAVRLDAADNAPHSRARPAHSSGIHLLPHLLAQGPVVDRQGGSRSAQRARPRLPRIRVVPDGRRVDDASEHSTKHQPHVHRPSRPGVRKPLDVARQP